MLAVAQESVLACGGGTTPADGGILVTEMLGAVALGGAVTMLRVLVRTGVGGHGHTIPDTDAHRLGAAVHRSQHATQKVGMQLLGHLARQVMRPIQRQVTGRETQTTTPTERGVIRIPGHLTRKLVERDDIPLQKVDKMTAITDHGIQRSPSDARVTALIGIGESVTDLGIIQHGVNGLELFVLILVIMSRLSISESEFHGVSP